MGLEIFLNDDEIPDLKMNRYYIDLYLNKGTNSDNEKLYQEEDYPGRMVHKEHPAEAEDPVSCLQKYRDISG
ncbi:MAG: hypothetical protein MZV70_61770 [Desulfobacterales bacterium]|nr:hypothetical protein [Desulfobacterales bacterium]